MPNLKWLLAAILFVVSQVQANSIVAANSAKSAPLNNQSFELFQGGKGRLSDYADQVVLLDFWASWCGPCRSSFPWMKRMQATYSHQGFKVLAVNLDQDRESAATFLREYPVNFPVLLDPDAKLPEAYGVMGMPTSYLIDRQGRIRAMHVGFRETDTQEYENAIRTLLAEG